MKSVSVAELKARLGKYLGIVKEGETVYVTSHRKPVAQLSPSESAGALAVQSPTIPMHKLKKLKGIEVDADAVRELLQDRRRR